MKAIHFAPIAALVLVATPSPSVAQSRIECESRDYQYNFCSAPDGVSRARLVQQRSRAPCIEGRSWGYDRRGIWVSNGCEGTFDYDGMRQAQGPRPGGAMMVRCESRDQRQQFCPVQQGVDSATLARQISGATCEFNRSWGWRNDGIWVSNGCAADFEVNTAWGGQGGGRPPSAASHVVCESRDYRYNFCTTGRLRDAQIVEQRSQAPCIRGRTWGVERTGIWVDDGCEAEFRVVSR